MKRKQLLTKTFLIAAMLFVGMSAWADDYTWTFDAYCSENNIEHTSSKDASGDLPSSTSTVISTSNGVNLTFTSASSNTASKIYDPKSNGTVGGISYSSYFYMGGNGSTTDRTLSTGTISGIGQLTIIYKDVATAGDCEIYNGESKIATITPTASTAVTTSNLNLGEGASLKIVHKGKVSIWAVKWTAAIVTYETPALYSQDFESYTAGEDTPGAAGWVQMGGTWSIETSSDASINKYAKFTPAYGDGGNRGAYYNFTNAVITSAGDYWKIEFDAAFKPGKDRTASSVAVTSANSANISTYEAASGSLYFLCKQKENDNNDYCVYIGSSEEEAVATYSLTEGTFYHFIITYDGTTVTAKIGSNSIVSKSVSSSTIGALKGLKAMASRIKSYYPYTYIDNITLHNFLPPSFAMSEDAKEILVGHNTTVDVTNVVGDISVSSSDETKVTASYADGTLTINGVAKGTATVTVSCFKNKLTVSKSIDVTVFDYSGIYATEKAVYDAKVDNLDSDGQAYWTANVTPVASVTDEASYNTAVAALPTTYIAAVKAQTTAGVDMTDAMPTGNAGWTCNQGNGPNTVKTTFTETYGASSAFYAGNIMSQTINGLPNGYYKVQFYGVVNAARSPSALTENTNGLAQAYANSTNEEITVYYQDDCTPSDYLQTIEAQVTDGTLTYGLKAKENVTDAGNWAVAKNYKLTYLGTDKNTYTINAVAGETTIKELTTGSVWTSETYGTYVPIVILCDNKYYLLDDDENANLTNYYASYTMGASNETKTINYTLDETIVAFAESGNNIYQSTSNNSSYSSGNYGHVDGSSTASLGTLTAGEYKFEAYYVSSSNRGLYLRNGNDNNLNTNTIVSLNLSSVGVVSSDFTLLSSTPVLLSGYTNQHTQYNQSAEFDYVLIRKTAEVASITSYGYATFSSTYALDFTNVGNAKAYIVTGQNATGTSVIMEKVEGTVAAGTGLVLESNNGGEATVTIPIVPEGASYNTNKLWAITANDYVSKANDDSYTNYVLSVQDNKVVFASIDEVSAPIKAGQAALSLPKITPATPAKSLSLSPEQVTTGINTVQGSGVKVNGYYDLQGRRVSQPTKGLYIMDGKKIIIK